MWEWFIVHVHIYNQNSMGGAGRTWRITVKKFEGDGVEAKLHDLAVNKIPPPPPPSPLLLCDIGELGVLNRADKWDYERGRTTTTEQG